ncbi:hypothetical protein DFQ28_009758 [Apophysomyces sp. BC1034]|nr:hypothetical protein DFQ29_004568 [Apophysomyces sp. BC1021]KAG0194550.1 hypothetical protein DFQ28_009758 [Apophysomyces sp. BC1034]
MWNNLYDLDVNTLATAYTTSTIMPYVYSHNNLSEPWPTLQEMINSGKRVINFVDARADTDEVPWLMYQFSSVFETPYDNTDMHGFKCTVDRPRGTDNTDALDLETLRFHGGIWPKRQIRNH